MPWDAELFDGAEVCDENAWLAGQFTPEVRQVVGTLPSGRQDRRRGVAIVTGAGSGIGQATARRFAEEGARLVLNDIRSEYLEELTGGLDAEHRTVVGDVAQEETAQRLAGTAREAFGRIDVLVNNVGDLFISEVTETSVED